MAAIATESIPSTWDDERDNAFFRITSDLFAAEFAYGAGVLLASYDDESEAAATTTSAITSSAPAAATTASAQVSVR